MKLGLLVFCAAGVILGSLAWWLQAQRSHQVVLSLEYDPSSLAALPGVSGPARREAVREFLQTQSLIITSRSTCQQAVDTVSALPLRYKVDSRAARERFAAEVCSKLRTSRLGESLVIELTYSDDSLERAQLVADAVATAYVGRTLAARAGEGLSPLTLAKELEVIDSELGGQELALSEFLQVHGIASFEDQQVVRASAVRAFTEALTETKIRHVRAGTKLAQLELALSKVSPLVAQMGDGSLDTLRERVHQLEAEQQKLALSSEGRHPRLPALQAELANARSQLEHAVRALEVSARAEVSALEKEERDLQRALDRAEQATLELARLRVEYSRLQRSASRHEALRSALLGGMKKPRVAVTEQGWLVRVLNQARPVTPWPTVALTLVILSLSGVAALVAWLWRGRPEVVMSFAEERPPADQA